MYCFQFQEMKKFGHKLNAMRGMFILQEDRISICLIVWSEEIASGAGYVPCFQDKSDFDNL